MKTNLFIKKLIAFLLVGLISCPIFFGTLNNIPTAYSDTVSTNLLTDGNFELSSTYNDKLAFSYYWATNDEDFSVYKTHSNDGLAFDMYSLRVSGKYEKSITHTPIRLEYGKTYRFGAFIKPTNINDNFSDERYATIEFNVKDDENILTAKSFYLRQMTRNVWNELSIYISPNKTGNFSLEIFTPKVGLNNIFFVDNMYVREESEPSVDKQNIEVVKGASIRLTEDLSGIRFQGKISAEFKKQMEQQGKPISAGILLTPTENIEADTTRFNLPYLDANNLQYTILNAKVWNNEKIAEEEGFYGYNCVMVDILPQNIDRLFSARAFVRYRDEKTGISEYIYSDFNLKDNSRCIYDIAKYWLAPGKIERFTKDQVKVLNSYVNAVKKIQSDTCTINGLTASYLFIGVKPGAVKLKLDALGDNITASALFNDKPIEISPSKRIKIEKYSESSKLLITLTSLSNVQWPDVLEVSYYSEY